MAITEKGIEALADVINSTAVLNVSLRDFFAAFALAGILSQPNGNPMGNPHDVGLRWCATTAYDLADAMLAQRKGDENGR